jgi:lysophospholipase L1-like esterase
MKKFFNFILPVFIAVIIFYGCQDRTDLTPPTAPSPKSGSVDFTRYVAIGNSLTAGYQSGALYQSAQIYAYPNLIAKVTGTPVFEQPLVSDPGLGGRIRVVSINPFITTVDPSSGVPLNLTYPAPYNDLGIPGALLYDVLNATNSTNCASALFAQSPNPLFDLVLRGNGSQFTQTKLMHPTFVTLWIGNNDILGYATSGGFSPSAPTATPTFQFLYSTLGDSIASLGAKVVVGNIPDVTSVPFFTTVGPALALQTPWPLFRALGAPGIIYEKHGEVVGTGVADSLSLLTGQILFTLTGSNYAPLIGTPTGKFYRDHNYPGLPLGIDTTKPFGLHPQNPWPDALVLDASEIATAESSTADFNAAIAAVASAKGFGLVDINSFFKLIRQHDFTGGMNFNGLIFTTQYVAGGIFSLDGVHPTGQGQAIIANEFIKVINSKFGASYSLVNVASIPGTILLAKQGIYTIKGFPQFDPGAFKHLLD